MAIIPVHVQLNTMTMDLLHAPVAIIAVPPALAQAVLVVKLVIMLMPIAAFLVPLVLA